MADERTPRELESRQTAERPTRWQQPQTLPEPNPEPGYSFRWIRLSVLGRNDPTNISGKFREGYEPVLAQNHPEISLLMQSENSQFKDNIVIGGLILCKIPAEFVDQRSEYYQKQANAQMNAVDNNFMRESDPRMPLFKERRSEVTFGSRKPQ